MYWLLLSQEYCKYKIPLRFCRKKTHNYLIDLNLQNSLDFGSLVTIW